MAKKTFYYKGNLKWNLGEPMQLVADTATGTSADGNDLEDARETMGSDGSGIRV